MAVQEIMKLKLNSLYLETYTVSQLANKDLYRILSQSIKDRILHKPLSGKIVVGLNVLYEESKYKKLI